MDRSVKGFHECTLLFFFFQAEDGIRDVAVTGVQTCALPICGGGFGAGSARLAPECAHPTTSVAMRAMDHFMGTSQARRCKRVGERARGAPPPFAPAVDSLAARRFHRRGSVPGVPPPTPPPARSPGGC